MVKQTFIGSATQFKPHQIVCLEYQNAYLYSEVIQVITSRQFCWVRPLMLSMTNNINDSSSLAHLFEQEKLIDLRLTSDLLLPLNLFRPALDTEVIHLIEQLNLSDSQSKNIPKARKQLNNFIHLFWQAYKDKH